MCWWRHAHLLPLRQRSRCRHDVSAPGVHDQAGMPVCGEIYAVLGCRVHAPASIDKAAYQGVVDGRTAAPRNSAELNVRCVLITARAPLLHSQPAPNRDISPARGSSTAAAASFPSRDTGDTTQDSVDISFDDLSAP